MKVTASGASKAHVYVDGLLLVVYQVKDQLSSSTSTLLRFSRSSSYSFRHVLCDRAVLIVLQTSQQRPIKSNRRTHVSVPQIVQTSSSREHMLLQDSFNYDSADVIWLSN